MPLLQNFSDVLTSLGGAVRESSGDIVRFDTASSALCLSHRVVCFGAQAAFAHVENISETDIALRDDYLYLETLVNNTTRFKAHIVPTGIHITHTELRFEARIPDGITATNPLTQVLVSVIDFLFNATESKINNIEGVTLSGENFTYTQPLPKSSLVDLLVSKSPVGDVFIPLSINDGWLMLHLKEGATISAIDLASTALSFAAKLGR